MKYLIDMPDDWIKGNCNGCPNHHEAICFDDRDPCPLANAVKAVEVKDHLDDYGLNEDNTGWFDIKGKPVKLYAVEVK